ncbi:hypothetical protein PInf_030371 [Phytophthora infestans]|nr:hypothetical protein PInf_030371 [Phytophthora infestans]
MGVLKGIVAGLNQKWDWKIGMLFCPQLANVRAWTVPDVDCMKIDCKTGDVKWVHRPNAERGAPKVIIVIETGRGGDSVFSAAFLYPQVDGDATENVTGNVKTHLIGGFNLQHAPERFRLVLALLNLCLLFPAIVQNCPASAGTEFMDIHRANGVKVRLSPIFVDKNFHTQEEYRRVKRIYDSLKAYRIPCADAVVTVDSDQLRLTLKPRGVEMKPCSLSELFVALGNVLEALVVLHRNGWMHRDIRWSNVIKHIDRVEWFLIDFADAAQSPQKYPSGDHLTHDEHASDIFMEGGSHTTAVDLWAVGYLVKTSKIEREWTAEPERALFLDRLMNTDPSARPTADEALQLLSRFEREAAEQESQGKGVRKKHRRA